MPDETARVHEVTGNWVVRPRRLESLATLLLVSCFSVFACRSISQSGCGYLVNVALLQPFGPRLNIGDTLTMHASFAGVVSECLPPDTTAAGLRWSEETGIAAIDSMTGHLIALRPGLGVIDLSQAGSTQTADLGSTDVGVFQPPGADSVVTVIRNLTGDTARVVVEDANGAVQRTQTLIAFRDSTCLVTPLSDSVGYSVALRPTPPPGTGFAGDSTVMWVAHKALEFNHTWYVVVDSALVKSVPTVSVELFGLPLDRGC